MSDARVGRRGIEARLVRLSPLDRLCQLVVDLEDQTLRAILAVGLSVTFAHDPERVHDVVDVLALEVIEVEERGVELRAEEGAALSVPLERRAVVAMVAREWSHVRGRIDELEDPRAEPLNKRERLVPWRRLVIRG